MSEVTVRVQLPVRVGEPSLGVLKKIMLEARVNVTVFFHHVLQQPATQALTHFYWKGLLQQFCSFQQELRASRFQMSFAHESKTDENLRMN